MAALSSPFSVSRTPATTKRMQTFPSLNETHARLRSAATHWQLEIKLTFEDNLQLVPQNVKDAVTGARLRYDMSLQPTPAGVLVEIITRLHGLIHVLQEASGFEGGKIHTWSENSLLRGGGLTWHCTLSRRGKKKQQSPSPAVTQSAVVHTLLRLERNSWPGRESVNIYEKARAVFDKSHPLLRKRRMSCEMTS